MKKKIEEYQAPECHFIDIVAVQVLCQSGLKGLGSEKVVEDDKFGYEIW